MAGEKWRGMRKLYASFAGFGEVNDIAVRFVYGGDNLGSGGFSAIHAPAR